jgi:O-antigen ligase
LRALLLAAALFAAAMAMHFTGGRDISADAGEDRTDLWGESMELLRSHPAFGVGYAQLPDYLGHTAHNSLLVCAAELGFFGLYFWTFFLVPTLRDAWTIASPLDVNEPVQIVEKPQLRPLVKKNIETIDKSQFNRLGRLLFLSLTGFLVAGWFLSRAFATTLFLLGGMVEVVYELALQRGMISPRMPATRILRFSGFLAIGLIIVMYMMLRTVNLMH